MALAVITVASGGLPVTDVTGTHKIGLPVSEVTVYGRPVTKVASGGCPVVYAPANSDGSPSGFTPTTWNAADLQKVSLSNGNLTATTTGSSNPVGVRGVKGLSSGKYYWEATMTAWNGSGTIIGIGTSSSVLFGGSNAGQAVLTKAFSTFGGININGSYSGSNLGTRANGDIVGIATDLTAKLIWFCITPSGNWNGSGAANPGTGAGGLDISSISGGLLFPLFAAGANPEIATANFGGSAFTRAVPSGFTAGWPA